MPSIVVSEYALLRPRRRPMWPLLDAFDPVVAELLERWAARRDLRQVLPAGIGRSQPRQHLSAVLDDRSLPLRLAGQRMAPSPAPRRRAATACSRVIEGRAALRVRDVDAGGSGLAPVGHARLSEKPLEPAPIGGHQGTQPARNRGLLGSVGAGPSAEGSSRSACKVEETGENCGCRRRDSNPRHADYDSAALTD